MKYLNMEFYYDMVSISSFGPIIDVTISILWGHLFCFDTAIISKPKWQTSWWFCKVIFAGIRIVFKDNTCNQQVHVGIKMVHMMWSCVRFWQPSISLLKYSIASIAVLFRKLHMIFTCRSCVLKRQFVKNSIRQCRCWYLSDLLMNNGSYLHNEDLLT